MKSTKTKAARTSSTGSFSGDHYGTGKKNPVGRVREFSSAGYIPVSKKQLKKPPTKVA